MTSNQILKEKRLIPFKEILERGHTPPWLVEDLIHEESCIFLNGAAKTGKTLFALRLAGAVSTGKPFAGRYTQKGKVTYLSLERQSALRGRTQAILDRGLPFDTSMVNAYTHRVMFGDSDQVEAFVDEFKGDFPRLLIVDTLRRSFDGDERDNNIMTQWCQGVELFRDLTGSSVIVIHHNRRDRTDYRGRPIESDYSGAGSLLGSFDAQLECSPMADRRVLFEIVNANEGNNFKAVFRSEQAIVFDTNQTWVMLDEELSEEDKPDIWPLVLDVLRQHQNITQSDWARRCKKDEIIAKWWPDFNRSTITRLLQEHPDQVNVTKDGNKNICCITDEDSPLELAS